MFEHFNKSDLKLVKDMPKSIDIILSQHKYNIITRICLKLNFKQSSRIF